MFYRKTYQLAPAARSLGARACRWAGVITHFLPLLVLAAKAAPIHHDLTVRLEPDGARIEVVDFITGLDPGPVPFELDPRFSVAVTTATGVEVELQGQHRTRTMTVPVTAAGQTRLRYSGTLPSLGSEPTRLSAFIDSAGSYLPAGWGWAPRVNAGEESYRITAIVPDPQRVLVTGRLQSERLAGGEYQAIFWVDEGVEPTLFAGPYVVGEESRGGIRLRTYFESELASLSPAYLNASSKFLERYSDSIGPYPFSLYSVVSAPLPMGLGFPGVAYISRQILPSPYMQGRSLAHEVLHNWWGNGVYVDYGAGNWAEGLTTFLADYALAEDKGAESANRMRLEWLRNLAALPPSRDLPAVRFRVKDHDAAQVVGYDKVAYFFYMLRGILGADDFAAGLRHLWQTQTFRIAGWSELRASFEAVSGRDLSAFFAQWLERAGAPRLHIDHASSSGSPAEAFEVALTLRQDAPVYSLTVPVVITSLHGSEERMIALDGRQSTAAWRVSDRPKMLAVDPDHRLLRKLAPRELPPIFRDVTLSDQVLLLIATEEPVFGSRARSLAERLMQSVASEVDLRTAERSKKPLLIIGADGSIPAMLEALDVATPAEVQVNGATLRAWVARRKGGAEVFTVSARDEQSLAAASGPLRYYGRRGYVVFADRKALVSGDWRSRNGPMVWRFD